MSTTFSFKIITCAILLVLLIIAGFYIHKTGKPYHALIFGVHKLFSVALVVILVWVFTLFLKGADPGFLFYLLTAVMILALIGLFVSGGMMSLDRNQEPMLVIHRISTVLLLVGFPVYVYMILH